MKNKRIVKFLGVLISSLIVLNSNGQILAKKVAKIKNIKQEEINKKRVQKRKNIKETKNTRSKLEKEILENNIKTFKNFKKEDYEIKGFNLTVFFKNGVPILYYEHIKTKAKIVIILADTTPKYSTFNFPIASFNFNISTENNKQYLANFIENAIISNFNYKDFKNKKFKGCFDVYVNKSNLNINFNVTKKEKNTFKEDEIFLKKLFLYLRDPKIFKDKKTFNLEKKRTLNYIKNHTETSDALELNTKLKDAENLTKYEIFNFYKERIHPSNLLVTRHESFKNIKKILNFLRILDENYLKYYNSKKNNFKTYITNVKSTYSVQPFRNERDAYKEDKKYKFIAYLDFLVDPSDGTIDAFIKKHPLLNSIYSNDHTLSIELLKNIGIKEYIKKLGYLDGDFDFSNLSLYGNDKNLFEEEKLKENSNKIFNYVLEKIKNISKKEIEEIYEKTILPIKEQAIKEQSEAEEHLFTNPIIFNADNALSYVLEDNFIYYNKPFPKEFFEITSNNEIKDSKENLINRILKDIENIETIRKEFNKNQYCNIKVYSNEIKDEKKQEKKHRNKLLIPLEVKNSKDNKTLEYLAKCFLTTNFLNIINYEYALPEDEAIIAKFLKSYVGLYNIKEKEISKDTLNFYYNYFENSIKNYKITKEDFEKTKKDFIGFITNKKFVASFNSGIEIIENFLKNGYEEKREGENTNRFFKITDKTPRSLMFRHYRFLLEDCLFENFDEFIKYAKNFSEFIKRHNVKSNEEDFTITKEFAKDLLENVLNPLKKIVERTENLKKEFEENIEKISFEEFIKYIKSAKPVEKEKLEKDQNKIKELEEMSSYEIFY